MMPDQKHSMSILAKCPVCDGTGRVLKGIPMGANPKAALTRPEKMGYKPCARCNGTGSIGIK